jgi:5,10-methylenetetrahydromethanopterin reductase
MTSTDGRLRVGVASLVEHPMPELAQRAGALEELGYDDIWVPDERLMRNVYVSLAAVAGATTHVGLGTAVTNPYTRHPTLTAASIATIDELSGGRATLAMGAGGGLGAYGIERRSPVQALREATDIIRRLTSGETVTWQGELFRLNGAHLDFPALRRVPVYLAARGTSAASPTPRTWSRGGWSAQGGARVTSTRWPGSTSRRPQTRRPPAPR